MWLAYKSVRLFSWSCFFATACGRDHFPRSLFRLMSEAISTEARAMHNAGHAGLTFFAPNINIYRCVIAVYCSMYSLLYCAYICTVYAHTVCVVDSLCLSVRAAPGSGPESVCVIVLSLCQTRVLVFICAGDQWNIMVHITHRDPLWGRGQETPGEGEWQDTPTSSIVHPIHAPAVSPVPDPYLTSQYAVQFVRGMQEGNDLR